MINLSINEPKKKDIFTFDLFWSLNHRHVIQSVFKPCQGESTSVRYVRSYWLPSRTYAGITHNSFRRFFIDQEVQCRESTVHYRNTRRKGIFNFDPKIFYTLYFKIKPSL